MTFSCWRSIIPQLDSDQRGLFQLLWPDGFLPQIRACRFQPCWPSDLGCLSIIHTKWQKNVVELFFRPHPKKKYLLQQLHVGHLVTRLDQISNSIVSPARNANVNANANQYGIVLLNMNDRENCTLLSKHCSNSAR